MKNKMASGLEDVFFNKMLKAADLYFNADKTKYDIYNKYLPAARNSNKINEARKFETNAEKLNASALQKYHKANFYSGHKSDKYIQIMDAVQTELSAIQEQENAYSIYFNKPAKAITPPIVNQETNNNNTSNELTYNYSGSYMYSKYNPKPVPVKYKNGIVFKVQVGLFKELLPLSKYGKYSPISYDTFKNNPYKRFMVGEYRSYKAAEYVLKKIKGKCLTDPFIVAYENGVKKSATYGISKIIRDKDFEKTETKEMSLLTGGVYKNNNNSDYQTTYNHNSTEGIKDISKFNGLIYCVQLGNFSAPKQKTDFPGVQNLISENNKAAYKYLAGPYSSYEEAKNESKQLNNKGYEGTFVVAYNYGTKISLNKAAEIKKSGNINIKTTNKTDIWFTVQIAAYSHKLNDAEMQEFGKLADKYTINVKQIDGGLFLYTIGKYASYKEAAAIKKEIKTLHYDGFVIAFQNGIKISAYKAIELLKGK
ncbi:MAG: SPOR domain-containing protein [Bacteroidales bacterium]|nr:SPOR domain-containing protein [Bacteroidales bacterium]